MKWRKLSRASLRQNRPSPQASPRIPTRITCALETGFASTAASTGLRLFPPTEHPDLALWALWSRNRDEEIEGVYSHQTALSLYDLSDLNPAKLHMTVPTRFRRNSEIPGIIVLHHADLPASDVDTAQGFRFTRPLRTILDLLEADTVARNFVRQALRQALDRGLITRHEIRRINLADPARKTFAEVLHRVT